MSSKGLLVSRIMYARRQFSRPVVVVCSMKFIVGIVVVIVMVNVSPRGFYGWRIKSNQLITPPSSMCMQ